jgi:arylsulfatase A-like enzyme
MIRSLACLVLLAGPVLPIHGAARPNIVLIIADDLGWRDVGWHGSEIHTPALDRLAKNGVRLERHYVYPTCSPTRAGLLSGRNPSRFGIHAPIAGRSKQALPSDAPTLARTLQAAGYDTALCGKWHLGLRPEVGPRKYGFAHSYGYLHGQIDPITHLYKNGDRSWHRNDIFVNEKGHATDLLADEAIRFIHKDRKGPFFLWLAFSVPHHPLVEEDRWLKPYTQTIKNPSRRLYTASVSHMDAAIGRVVAALQKRNQLDSTFILFTSDNGGQERYSSKTDYGGKHGPNDVLGDNRPWRGWKGSLHEGGIRVPALAHRPAELKPGIVKETLSYLDWFPTLAALARTKAPAGIEGRDVSAVLHGKKVPPIHLYWNTGAARALLDGDWKLIVPRRGKAELYDLGSDPTEKNDLADRRKDKVESLMKLLREDEKIDAKSSRG